MSPGGFPRLALVQSDQRLLALARDGDERAFETLVRRHRRPLIRYCRRMGLSEARAEDVLQQALLQAWLALKRGSDVHAPKAWLHRTVHNIAVNVLRSSRDDHGPLEDRKRVDTSPSAESAFERRIAVRQTLSDVAALPQMQRDAIVLTSIDGRSHAEVASALGVSHGAVRGLLYRARATLRDAAAVVVPQPALLWASGLLGRMAPSASRIAELSAPAGNADFGAALAKGAALAATAAALALGTGIVPLSRHLAHRSKTAVLALGIAPSTAEASEPPVILAPAGVLEERTSQARPLASQGFGGSRSSRPRSTAAADRRAETGGDGIERRVARAQENRLSGSGRSASDSGGASDSEQSLSTAPSESSPSGAGPDSTHAAESGTADRTPAAQGGSGCDQCAESSAGRATDTERSQAVPIAPAAVGNGEAAAEPQGRD
ncbi:MAG TPA: sigma-70 family RNA polymerase sigma factor [Solirubrobacteraceae bacterium]|jgi:RNA polymerase sigma factor (sigma-70 family)|nr:sigma-70 family RNA polymerase sigma factor [Solirubrobacteraceae bacterium]